MRRKPGTLLPLEEEILATALELRAAGTEEFHGFGIAADMRARDGARRLTAHGTLYKALGRLAEAGLLASRWEDPAVALREGRPARRLYRVTGAGELAYTRASARSTASPPVRRGLEPT